jgi:hypothetical protein
MTWFERMTSVARGWSGVAAAGTLVALLLAAAPAEAQCSDADEAPEAVFASFEELVGGLYPLPAQECAKIVKTAVAACHAAVADSVQCVEALFKSVTKARKTACGTLVGEEKTECIESLESFLSDVEEDVALEAEVADGVCDEQFADAISDDCLGIGSE